MNFSAYDGDCYSIINLNRNKKCKSENRFFLRIASETRISSLEQLKCFWLSPNSMNCIATKPCKPTILRERRASNFIMSSLIFYRFDRTSLGKRKKIRDGDNSSPAPGTSGFSAKTKVRNPIHENFATSLQLSCLMIGKTATRLRQKVLYAPCECHAALRIDRKIPCAGVGLRLTYTFVQLDFHNRVENFLGKVFAHIHPNQMIFHLVRDEF